MRTPTVAQCKPTITLLAGICLGACATAGLSSATGSTPRASAAIIHIDQAPGARSPADTATIRHLARGDAAYLGMLSIDANAQVPEHADPTEEYIFVIDGGGTVRIDGEETQVQAGSVIFMPAGATVSYVNGPQPTRVLQVFAGPEPADKYSSWPSLP